MAATETSILILGAVMTFEPVNGYQVRRELLSWGVEEWGHINPGSIYSMLATQAGQGHLSRHEVADGKRSVAVYTSTPAGREEFQRLCRDALVQVDPLAPMPFQTALNFTQLIPRADYLRCLRLRTEGLIQAGKAYDEQIEQLERTRVAPDQVAAISRLQRQLMAAELAAVEVFVERVERGEMDFAGEAPSWVPAENDPGWAMHDERARYRSRLGLDAT